MLFIWHLLQIIALLVQIGTLPVRCHAMYDRSCSLAQSVSSGMHVPAVAALAGLQRCIAQHASKLPYVMGWNISSSSSSSTPGINSAPGAAAVTAQLAALGVPGEKLPRLSVHMR